MTKSFELAPGISVGSARRPVYIAGPCVVESEEMALEIATALKEVAGRHRVPLVFKASYDKANRSSFDSFRGIGIPAALAALGRVRKEVGLPVLTDVHDPAQVAKVAPVADVLQVPAFLCRQTDLLVACGKSGRAVNVKKGQFMAPEDMVNAVNKVRSTGNERVTITERGTSFGYRNLVVDVRAFPMMRRFAPVIFDITHSLQLPGGLGHATDGAREYHPYLARAAAAAGVDGFFVEVHPDPDAALSDSTTQISVEQFDALVPQLEAVIRGLGEALE
jgi:2-dehydro-3-deoxyphosphooctonate aldolase (KDO 8-P synthase)